MTELEQKVEEYFSHHKYALHNRYGIQKDIHIMIYKDGYKQGQDDEQMKTKVIEHLEKENAELKAQIKKMKCCGNCKKMSEVFPSSVCDICNNKNNWELAE